MTQVTFYLLDQNGQDAEHFTCRLVDKAWRAGIPLHIHTSHQQQSQLMDRLLWDWREDSFLPHGILDGSEKPDQFPITISHKAPSVPVKRLMINLNPDVPDFFDSFIRVCEIVVQNPDLKEVARGKFRAYKKAGITPETHNMAANG